MAYGNISSDSLVGVVSTLVAMFIVGYPYAYFIGVAIVILIVGSTHRRTKNVHTSDL